MTESPTTTAATFACPRDERERLAVSNHTRRYRTWTQRPRRWATTG